MVYKQDNIASLVEKYWAGQTSLEEEAVLSDYFRYNDYPEQFSGVASYFQILSEEEQSLGEDFDQAVLSEIGLDTPKRKIISLHAVSRYLAAACIVLAIGTSFWYVFQEPVAEPVAVTLEDPDVRAAFEQTKSALMMVGSRLNEGKEQAVKLNKYNEATEVLKGQE